MVGRTLAHYEIESKLGEGGMGVVYKARDTRLERFVALKVLPPDKLADAERKRRFVQEARAASALNHPNIITIHEIADEGGVDYMVMELVHGTTLRERIDRGPIEASEAVRYAVQLADALAAAHGAGITHRDLKPANVMVSNSGLIKVLDFGLAKLAPAPHADKGETLTAHTQLGMVLGTLAYMSPEQAEGRAVDARSDLFSFGAMFYEMLSGKRPFRGDTNIAVMTAILRDEPKPLGTSLDDIVIRCLRKDPKDRFQRASELKSALEQIGRKPSAVPSLAVLPFINLNRDDESEFFADGITEDLISALTKLKGLRVVARSMVFQFKGQNLSARAAGEQLKVGTVLEGTVRRAGKRLRVTVQLVDVSDGFPIWSERYDRILEDVFEIQDEISRAIVERLEVQLTGAQAGPIVKRATGNMEAYQLYQQGRFHWAKRTPDSIARAIVCFERALSLDPDYALAYAGLADCYTSTGIYGARPSHEVMPKAKEAARKALEFDENLAEAHNSLAFATCCYNWDWPAAERGFQHARELNPNVATIHLWYAFLLANQGRFEEALTAMRRARELDPVTAVVNVGLGYCLLLSRRYAEALDDLKPALELDPFHPLTNFALGTVYACLGEKDRALATFQNIPMTPWRLGATGWLLGGMGKRDEAAALLGQLAETPAFWKALIHLGLEEHDLALTHLEADFTNHEAILTFLMHFPILDPIRSHPRFQTILRKMNII